jgi:hypothetical protein
MPVEVAGEIPYTHGPDLEVAKANGIVLGSKL